MKISVGQPVPAFSATDAYGKEISSKTLLGRKTLISFMRNVGCPVCNFQAHELLKNADSLNKKGIDVILIYQSSPQLMQNYLGQEKYPFSFVPDPENQLYRLFSVERSMGKMMKGMFHGAMGKMAKGKKLFVHKLAQDGDMDMIGADFLIDAQGNVKRAYYGSYLGDHIALSEVFQLLK